MIIKCVWEHNGNDTLLHAVDFPGAFTRGETKEIALAKMGDEIGAYTLWAGEEIPYIDGIEIIQDAATNLQIRDADSDVLFEKEKTPLTHLEYERLKWLALKSANDFMGLYQCIPDRSFSDAELRNTFYGQVPRTAEEMYRHTKNVNEYYFGEINVNADNEGDILQCRTRGFAELEKRTEFLFEGVVEGSYGELWSLRKVIRRFLWHDRIHAKAMYKMAVRLWGKENIIDPFKFDFK